jgi:hypothetical protein
MKKVLIVIIVLISSFLISCQGVNAGPVNTMVPANEVVITLLPTVSPTPIAQSTKDEQESSSYEFPSSINPANRYMFYLHGRILEDQGIPAISPEYGEYQYDAILRTLQNYGFVIISERRPKNANVWEYAQRTAQQVDKLLAASVPPGSITIVGASKGAAIATLVSSLEDNSQVNYVLLGTCHSTLIDEWKKQGLILTGNVLAIYDFVDKEYSGSCEELFSFSKGKGLNRHDELVLQVGTGHGILYEPLSEWVLPTVRWANQEW